MSDFYDSLEDESDENKCESGPPEKPKTANYAIETPESPESPAQFSFFLKENSSEDEKNLEDNDNSLIEEQEKHFLPKIKNKATEKGVEIIRDKDLENQILNKQGLQLNNDGSITKSPRIESEELPFITREYRNLQFQKRKTFVTNTKNPVTVNQNKNVAKVKEKQTDGINLKLPNSAKWKKDSNERLITRNSSFPNPTQSKTQTNKQFHNMTDSMKEKLLKKENFRNTFVGNMKKEACETNLSKTPEVLRQKKFSDEKLGDQKKNSRFVHRLQKNPSCLDSSSKQFKAGHQRIHGYPSDISLTTLRPKLNYLDKHQLENGFNVFHLKQFNKKVESDSNRSNFGDSVVDELPEVSTLPPSCGNTAREDEELFYKQLIEKDKFSKEQKHLSARSEGPVGKVKHIGSTSYKSQTKILEERQNLLKLKNLKYMKIDLPSETQTVSNPPKRWSHFCTDNSSKNASKIELALKGKTYGHLANARNIFRLKALSERKLSGKEENSNINGNIQPTKKISDSSQGSKKPNKHSSPPVGIFPNVKGGLPRYLDKSPRGSKSCSKTKVTEMFWDVQKEFVLPQVLNEKNTNYKNSKG